MQNFINENTWATWILTVLVEYGVWMAWIRRSPVKFFGYCILVNTLTQPLAVWIYHSWALSLQDYKGGHVIGILLIIEIGVLLTEWLLIKGLLGESWMKAFMIALSANAATAAMSFLY